MSVVGIDLGNVNCVIAQARGGGIEVLTNEVTQRQTPAVVTFCGGNERYVGEAAATRYLQNVQRSITESKRILGRSLLEDEVQHIEAARALYSITEEYAQGGSAEASTDYRVRRAAVQIHYSAEQLGTDALELWHLPPEERARIPKHSVNGKASDLHVLPVESVTAMILQKLNEIVAASNHGIQARDVVLSVPVWYTDAQRAALLDAAAIADVRVLRMVHEHLAAALAYGLYRATELPENDKEPVQVIIADVGHSQTTAACVAFWRSRLEVRAVAFDRNLGGRDFDEMLFHHFAKLFAERYRISVGNHKKAIARLRQQCEKVKKILSANALAHLNLDCFVDDIDVEAMIQRAEFETLVRPLAERIVRVVQQVVASTPEPKAIQSIELIGGGSRVPLIQSLIEQTTGLTVRRTLNTDECIARGCALQAAILAPGYRVREYEAVDFTVFPICIAKSGATGTKETLVFAPKSAMPSLKRVTYSYTGQPFELRLFYGDDAGAAKQQGGACSLPQGCVRDIALVEIGVLPNKSPNCGRVHVKVRLDANGMVSIVGAQLVEEVSVAESAATEAQEASQDAGATNQHGGEAPDTAATRMDQEIASDGAAADDSARSGTDAHANGQGTAPARKVIRTELPIRQLRGTRLQHYALNALIEIEQQMQAADRYRVERAEALNALETYVYDMRSRVSTDGPWAIYMDDASQSAFLRLLDETEDWIYSEEGSETAPKSTLIERQQMLERRYGAAVKARALEYENIADAAHVFRRAAASLQAECASAATEKPHISVEDIQKLEREIASSMAWLEGALHKVEKAPKHKDPPLKAADIEKRRNELVQRGRQLLDRPVPSRTAAGESGSAPNTASGPGAKTSTSSSPNTEQADTASASEPGSTETAAQTAEPMEQDYKPDAPPNP
jgi:heat shock protein 4